MHAATLPSENVRILYLFIVAVLIGLLGNGCASTRHTSPSTLPTRSALWQRVVAIPPGTDVQVHRRDSPSVSRGTFLRADDDTLVLATNGLANDIAYDVVTRVSVLSGRPWKRNIRWGIAGGVIYGVLAGGLYGRDVTSLLALSGLGAYVGTMVGALAALATPTMTVVYTTADAATPFEVTFVPSTSNVSR